MVLALHRLFPNAPVYTGVYDPDGTYPEFRSVDVRPSLLQRLPHSGNKARALLPLYAVAFERLTLRDYDVVVSSSSGWAHGSRVERGLHLCYCHTPARWLYDTERYFTELGPVSPRLRPTVLPLLRVLRRWDQAAARRPDVYVTNSRHTAGRIAAVYGRRADVVPPPVDFRGTGARQGSSNDEAYVLVVARLLPYKRVDLVIDACAALGLRLIVVGDGPARAALSKAAGASVDFRSGVSEAELGRLLANCIALVQAGEEDFGIAPLEANAAGRPVVAFGRGGALETVIDGTTGILFNDPSSASLADALKRALEHRWKPTSLREHAECFHERRFQQQMLDLITSSVSRTVVETA